MTAGDFDRLSRRHKPIIYADYIPKEDFTLWLSGFREKVRAAGDFSQAQNAEVDAEVVKQISSKLHHGTALDTYNRLTADEKDDYETMKSKLTAEFLDPQERRKFMDNFGYNKRKKGQSLKELMQEIIKDMGRYSDMPDTIRQNGVDIPNPAKEKEGVRRFKKGMRTKEGEKDKALKDQLKFHLHQDADMTWKKALGVAERWETANDTDSDDANDKSDNETVEVVDTTKGAVSKTKSKPTKIISAIEAELVNQQGNVATLADQVKMNTMDIKSVKTEQERSSIVVQRMAESVEKGFDRMAIGFERLDSQQQNKQQQNNQQQNNQQRQTQYPSTNVQRFPSQQRFTSPTYGQGFQRNPQNPQTRGQAQGQQTNQSWSWKGRVGQTQQTGFGLARRSPQSFTRGGGQNSTGQQRIASIESGMAQSIEEDEEPMEAELSEDTVNMPRSSFIELMQAACLDVRDQDMVQAVEDVNFP